MIFSWHRLFGFLAGTVAASAAVYYYILGEYRVSNEMLSEDIDVCDDFVPVFCSSSSLLSFSPSLLSVYAFV